jgi:ATP-dependent Clp protease ATP-binding subunit ClpA
MFERYSEPARRAIFFARYEAGAYGSRYIETEHLLLGLLREKDSLLKWFPGKGNVEPEIRAEIEKRVTRGNPFPTTIEVPLSSESRTALKLAEDSCEKLGHQTVEPEHLVIGLLRVESSLAAQILAAREMKLAQFEERFAKGLHSEQWNTAPSDALLALNSFLAGLKQLNSESLSTIFSENAQFIDATGKRWSRVEIRQNFATLFSRYAKKNASYVIEDAAPVSGGLSVMSVLWKNELLASEGRSWMHRMSVVLTSESGEWEIVLVQVTPVQTSWPARA